MNDSLGIYIPMDRRQALAHKIVIPDRVNGAALFADISGFTPLTAALADELGRQRGAEEVLNHINPIYEAVISKLHEYRGSVIGFAGDSITCWLDGDDGRRAVACALAMQEIMGRFATITTPGGAEVALSIKVGVSAGPARRFLAGNPQTHNFDALAGATLERMAAAEGQAEQGEVLVSKEVVDRLGDLVKVAGWRSEEGTERSFAVVNKLDLPVEADPWPALPLDALDDREIRAWIDAPVYERLVSGASFLAELRPATSLFLKFGGIDYDKDDDAGKKLDAFVRWVQTILLRYDGAMLQLTIGDKGSNLLAVFGAPVTHDDDNVRAVAAALDLQAMPPELDFIAGVKIGVSQGLVWAGACGGRVRCIYSVMGDEVNMAARLMGKAEPGQIMVNQGVADATSFSFQYHYLGEIQVKGKTEPLPVSEAVGRQVAPAGATSALLASSLVGREAFLEEMRQLLAAARQGQGQVLRLEGTAGVGKSHLAAVFAEGAAERGWRVALGACQSISQNTAYAPWRQLLTSLLGLSGGSAGAQIKELTGTLIGANPEWEFRIPLLGDLLGLPIPDNEATAALEPRLRQQTLFSLVAEIVQSWAKRQPLLLLLEDVHWLDEASAGLTVAVGRAIARSPAALLLVQRPPLDADRPILPELDHLPTHHYLQLGDLSPEGVAALAGNRLQGSLSPLVSALILAQSQGNPFFTEELVDVLREANTIQPDEDGRWVLSEEAFNALLDGNCIVKVEGEWGMVENPPLSSVKLDIPDSVHGTVLARMDRLPEGQKLTLKVASVIGRVFPLDLLQAAHPGRPALEALRGEIEAMKERDFVRVEAAGSLPVYIFKHSTTQEVAYGTLLFAQRQGLHTAVAQWHEGTYGGDAPLDELTLDSALAPYYPLLVHHWRNAENEEPERRYAALAGQQAAQQYANEGAVRYFGRALELTPESELDTRYNLLLGREGVYDVLGRRNAQAEDLAALADLAGALADLQKSAAVSLRQAKFADSIRDYPAALEVVQRAVTQATQAQDQEGEVQSYHEWGRILVRQGNYDAAKGQYKHALRLAQTTRNRLEEARCLYDLGVIDHYQADYEAAQDHQQQARAIYRAIGHRPGEIQCLIMFGEIYYRLGDYMAAQADCEQALSLSRAIGWRMSEAFILGSLGNTSFDIGDYQAAQTCHREALTVYQEIGDREGEAVSLDTLGLTHHILGDNKAAQELIRQALAIQQEIGDRHSEGYSLHHLGQALVQSNDLAEAKGVYCQALQLRRELGMWLSAGQT